LSDREAQKRRAAERAVDFVESGMKLGLGTGSTARHVLEVIADRRRAGKLQDIVGVPTSEATARLARELGIPMSSLDDLQELDLGIDGADEVDPELNLIKGLGGALLWEKIVAAACRRFVVVVDDSKLVQRLGQKAPLPVEVVPFAWSTHLRAFAELGAQPSLRTDSSGAPFVTDGGHHIIDLKFPTGIIDAFAVDAELHLRPGVVETGLFLDMTDHVVIAGKEEVTILQRALR
jgi:ribose 5-phosphate isomerase A